VKTVTVTPDAPAVHALLEEARREDVLLRLNDGTEFYLSVVEDFDREIARTRQNAKLLAFLEERGKQPATKSLADVKSELGLD
jgi:hypothetical protein